MRCCVKDCRNHNDSKACSISFFSFPLDPQLRKLWLDFCGTSQNFNPRTSHICMEHFPPEAFANYLQYEMGFTKRRLLKPGAIPSIKANENSEFDKARIERIKKCENRKTVELLLQSYNQADEYEAPTTLVAAENVEPPPPPSPPVDHATLNRRCKLDFLHCFAAEPPPPPPPTPPLPQPRTSEIAHHFHKRSDKDSLELLKSELHFYRKENSFLKKLRKKQTAALQTLMEKLSKAERNGDRRFYEVRTQLIKANFELKNMETKLLGLFTKQQIRELKEGIKRPTCVFCSNCKNVENIFL